MSFRYAESPVVVTNVGTLELYFTFVGTFITGNTLSFSLLGTLLQHPTSQGYGPDHV